MAIPALPVDFIILTKILLVLQPFYFSSYGSPVMFLPIKQFTPLTVSTLEKRLLSRNFSWYLFRAIFWSQSITSININYQFSSFCQQFYALHISDHSSNKHIFLKQLSQTSLLHLVFFSHFVFLSLFFLKFKSLTKTAINITIPPPHFSISN